MAFPRAYKVTATTDSSGDATVYLPGEEGSFSGPVYEIEYVKTDFADGVDFTITAESNGAATAKNIWVESNVNASKVVYPTVTTHDTTGTEGSGADYVVLANQRIKIVIASGGSVKTGTFYCKVG